MVDWKAELTREGTILRMDFEGRYPLIVNPTLSYYQNRLDAVFRGFFKCRTDVFKKTSPPEYSGSVVKK
jgi:hypothetical protein